MKTLLPLCTLFLFSIGLATGQSDCTPIPEVDFPGGRVVMSFDGNVHDDDDIVAMAYSAGLWWAAGLQDKVVQFEYNNHTCDTNVSESDGGGAAGSGDDSQNMRQTASGAISQFGYNANLFYDYERQGSASTAKMAAEIEKSSASDPLWIIAAGPMETVWRGFQRADKGFDHVTVISHSTWNERHTHCSGAHDWDDLKDEYQSRGVFFVENCDSGGCGSSNKLNDQNGGFNSNKSNWTWMRDSDIPQNRWIYGRNPFTSSKFDPSDAGMSYYLITGGPFDGGDKTPDHTDARKLMENPCLTGDSDDDEEEEEEDDSPNESPVVSISSPDDGQVFSEGDDVSIDVSATDDGQVAKYQIFVDDKLVDTDGSSFTPYIIQNVTEGTYDIRVEVTDDFGQKTVESISISVENDDEDDSDDEEEDDEDEEEEDEEDDSEEEDDDDDDTEEDTNPDSANAGFSFASPSDGAVFPVGQNITVDLSASSGSDIVKYQIFVNDQLVDTDPASFTPYRITNAQEGTYTVRAEATASNGAKTVKSLTVQVEDDQDGDDSDNDGENEDDEEEDDDGDEEQEDEEDDSEEEDDDDDDTEEDTNTDSGNAVFSFASPSDGAVYPVGQNISVDLSAASGSDIVRYQIFVNGKLVDTDPAYFTPYRITNARTGTYTIRAEVTERNGSKSVKTVVVRVGDDPGDDNSQEEEEEEDAPEVDGPISISVSPADGARFTEGSDVSVSVTASSGNGRIIKYRIFVNGSLKDTDPAYFTPYIITDVNRGIYTVKVEVTDDQGRMEVKTVRFSVGSGKTSLLAARAFSDSPDVTADESVSLRIAPNPVQGAQLNVFQKRADALRIINIYGVLVKQIDVAGNAVEIDISGLAPGVYLLESDTERTKFIVPE